MVACRRMKTKTLSVSVSGIFYITCDPHFDAASTFLISSLFEWKWTSVSIYRRVLWPRKGKRCDWLQLFWKVLVFIIIIPAFLPKVIVAVVRSGRWTGCLFGIFFGPICEEIQTKRVSFKGFAVRLENMHLIKDECRWILGKKSGSEWRVEHFAEAHST